MESYYINNDLLFKQDIVDDYQNIHEYNGTVSFINDITHSASSSYSDHILVEANQTVHDDYCKSFIFENRKRD